ncbi:nucleoside-diphosphate kinase [Fonticella tunisiensis]|uniref:Nucleoside diphosphate kinase n=1 Tax=Fonticella tunisiensis TaxID=1096341 RepID=A0A4R7KAQ5_9CLOT|nr:nucleoside-diphosphate kinase [Fonticella tunisiensis]TDT50916.1 nucleoside diphosphate kinase [Fonticella tunisiensis]
MERTLILIKPDGVRRNLIGEIIRRYEMKGLKIVSIKSMHPSRELVEEHYAEHRGKPFFNDLIEYLTSGMVVACIVEGSNAIKCVRLINGATKYYDALPGTIRGDFACDETQNLVHASDCEEAAKREIGLWFPEG